MSMQTDSQREGGDALPRSGAASIALGAAVLLGAMAMAPMAAAESPLLGPLEQISGPSPFGSCTADNVPDQEAEGSVVFQESEVEPYVHVNPTNTNNVVAVWQQDRWSDGGARGDIAAVSDDGGETWETVTPPQFTVCAGGDFERATDPWVGFGPDGAVYFMSLSFDSDPAIFGGHHAMQVSKSTDGGHSWGLPVNLIEENELLAFNDKNSLTADPTNANLVYGIWDRLELFETTPPQLEALSAAVRFEHDRVLMAGRRLQQMRTAAAAEAAPEPPEFKGPTYFTRSTDGGDTWQLPHIIYDPGADNQTINNLVEVLPDGVIVALFTEILNTNQGVVVNIALKRSFDQGFTFTPVEGRIVAQRIFTNAIFDPFVGVFTPNKRRPVRDGGILFDSAVDPQNGHLYLVWQDNRFNGVDQIAFSQSTDGGMRWSEPIKINQTPDNANIRRTQGFVPTVAVNSDGLVAVTYYDFRNDDRTGELTDHWIILCDPGKRKEGRCSNASNWKGERRLTKMSFDILDAPVAGNLFLGDYMGQANADTDFLPVFGIADGPGESSIFVRRVTPTTEMSALTE